MYTKQWGRSCLPAMQVVGRPATTMEWRRLLLCLVVMYVLVGTVVVAAGRPPAMYVFGTSILDVGNNNYLRGPAVDRANHPHNGVDFPGSIPTGRFSNGYNIADYVAKTMGFTCSPPTYLSLAPTTSSGGGPLVLAALRSGVNYASGGAGILDSTNAGSTIPLSKQVEYFGATKAKMVAAVGSHAVDALLSKSFFLLGVGNNDMYVFAAAELLAGNKSAAGLRRDAAVLYANLLSNYSATVTELYSMGVRKLAIVNVWLVGCVPGVRAFSSAGACSDTLNQVAGGFDDRLRSLLAGLAPKLPGLVYSLGDAFGFTRDAVADPRALGYTDVATACCGSGQAPCLPNSTLCADRDQHVFWDRAHPSQRTAFLTTQAFYDGPAKYTTPINFMQLAQYE